jgi:dipeptidase
VRVDFLENIMELWKSSLKCISRLGATRIAPAAAAVCAVASPVFLRLVPAVVVILLWLSSNSVWACYAVIVGRHASADGSVLVGHNEENGGRRVLNFRRVPRRTYDEGAVVRLLRGGELPQVPQTWSFLWSENPGLEFSDAYLNEWGVAIVSDACPTREDDYETLVQRGEIRDGGIGYMLRRLVAERARSARAGVELVGGLVERFGYVHSGRTYVIADPHEAWLVAVVRGRRWVARRVPDDVVVLLPNLHILERIDLRDKDNFPASADLATYATARGWYEPEHGEFFNFRHVYGLVEHMQPDPRRQRGRQLAMGLSAPGTPQQPISFGVRPARKMTVAAVARILRDRSSERPISSPVIQESAVFQLRADGPREIGCVYWRATAEPSISVFTPWYLGIDRTPPGYYRPVDISTQLTLEHHFDPPPGTFDEDPRLAWWTFKKLQDLVHQDFGPRIEVVRPLWSKMERRVFGSQSKAEQRAIDLWQSDPQAARDYLTRYCAEIAAEACAEARKLIDRSELRRTSS